MRLPICLCALSLAAGLAGCTSAPTETSPASRPKIVSASADGPEKTVQKFLTWTAAHYNKLPSNFVDHTDGRDTTKYYAVNFSETNRWLAVIKQSGVFSEVYLNSWRAYFQQYADTLRLHPQNDGPPRGFEYDFLLTSQEPDTKLSELQLGRLTTQLTATNRAIVHALGPQHDGWREGYDFYLSQGAAGQWLIDSTSIPDNLVR
jgi:hypothetical protein